MMKRYGRIMAFTLCGVFVLLPPLHCQESATTPKKVLTPEQKVYQQQMREYWAKRQSLQAQAKQVFDAEMAREKAGDCPGANSTYDFNICYGEQTDITNQNLKNYEELLRGLMAPTPRMPGAPTANPSGPAGPSLSPEELSAEFDRMEQSWRIYRETACTAAFHQYGGGTGGPSFEMQCKQKLSRDHLREIDMIFFMDLSK